MEKLPILFPYEPGSLIEYPGHACTYWCCLCKDGIFGLNKKLTQIGCSVCNTWAHEKCLKFKRFNNEEIKKINYTCLKCHPYLMILIFAFESITSYRLKLLKTMESLFPMRKIIHDPVCCFIKKLLYKKKNNNNNIFVY